jgi:hypothetical protein
MTLDEYFTGHVDSRLIFDELQRAVAALGPVSLGISKSQVAFRRRRAFAWAWMPGKYLHGQVSPLVLTLSFPSRDPSPRWKQVVEPAPGRFTHHLELRSPLDIDDQVCDWLRAAWETAG